MNMCNRKSWLLALSAGASAIGLTSGAAAQTTNATAANAGVDNIIVTAQRREERIQDVPIAITAFSGERLQQQNIATAQDLNNVVPSLQVSTAGQATRGAEAIVLRGIGPTYQGNSSVVMYLAEVPLPQARTTSQQGGQGNFVDLENLQALAGPQGTLFGRNTTGGAVLLVPHKPTNEFEGYIQASAGNYDYRGLEGVVNIPLIPDKLMVRIVGNYQDRNGFTKDLVWNKRRDDLHYYSGRIGITFKPTEKIENYLLVFGSDSRNNGTAYINKNVNPFFFCADPFNCPIIETQNAITAQLGPREVRTDADAYERDENWGAINKTSIELSDELTLNNIVSYQRLRKDYATDEDGTPFQIAEFMPKHFPNAPVPGLAEFGIPFAGWGNLVPYGPRDNKREITEEFQLQGNFLDHHLTFTAGGFYSDEKPYKQLNRGLFFCIPELTGTQLSFCSPSYQLYGFSTKSKALYAQATLDLGAVSPALESLRVTGGYRYTWDSVDGHVTYYRPWPNGTGTCLNGGTVPPDGTQPDLLVGSVPIWNNPDQVCVLSNKLKYKAPTWTLGVDYKPISNIMVYAKVSRGYKAGGFNAFAVRPTTLTYGPEKLMSYEAGFKSDWKLGTVPVRLNVSAYKSDYSNIQLSAPDAVNGSIGSQIVPGSAKIKGVEVETSIRPFPALEIGGNLSYIHGRNETTIVPFSTPKWSYNIHGSLDLPVPEAWGAVNFYANYAHVSKQTISATDSEGTFSPYGLLNMSLRWKGVANSPVDLELFGTNVTNKLYKITTANLESFLGFTSVIYGEPRMYGVRIRYRFGE